jgi:hypothetical protein
MANTVPDLQARILTANLAGRRASKDYLTTARVCLPSLPLFRSLSLTCLLLLQLALALT